MKNWRKTKISGQGERKNRRLCAQKSMHIKNKSIFLRLKYWPYVDWPPENGGIAHSFDSDNKNFGFLW